MLAMATRTLVLGALPLLACGRLGFAPGDAPGDADGEPADGALGPDASRSIDGAPGPDAAASVLGRAFVTAASYQGDFGSSSAGDAICQAAADGQGLGGTFVALLADSTRGHLDALAGSRGWVDLDGLPLADQPSDWLDGRLRYPLRRTELGSLASGTVWLGSDTHSCDDWTTTGGGGGAYGKAERATLPRPTAGCGTNAHLFCVEVGRNAPLPPTNESGRNIFISQFGWSSGGGLASADAFCDAEASAAGLPGSYLAALGSSAGGPMARFDPEGAPWRRVDGVRVTTTAAEFASMTSGTVNATFVNRDATGEPQAAYFSTTGSPLDHCADWTSTSGALIVAAGWMTSADVDEFWGWGANTCADSTRLLCVQE